MKFLVVDDELVSRSILEKKLKSFGECTSVDGGQKAIKLFDKSIKTKKPFHLITLDVSMPKIDGKQLLGMIRQKEKAKKIPKKDRVKIIMVTSRINISTIRECIGLGCNGYISKPVSKIQLVENLAKFGLVSSDDIKKEKRITHAQNVAQIIKRFYEGKIKLPVLPIIVQKVKKIMEGEDPSIEDLVKVVKKDILISTKLISIANSPLYRGRDNVDNLNAALVRLGIKATYGLISTLITEDLFKSDNKTLDATLDKLWKHSFACACIAKRIAEVLGIGNSDTIFLMGIVHDIGKMLVLRAIADMYPEEPFEKESTQVAIHEIHTTFGAAALKKMRFSNEFVQIAEFHHWNDFSDDDQRELLIINLSDYLANKMGYAFYNIDPNDGKVKFGSPESIEDLKNLASLVQLKLSPKKAMEIAIDIKPDILASIAAF
ncbi:MAG: HDOD domain-containing protein [Desulfobacteraceae bacterium]|nr:HDOD domain-containing protein [Desulfobacteraceae bacterium]